MHTTVNTRILESNFDGTSHHTFENFWWTVRKFESPGRPVPDVMSKLALADPNQILHFYAGPEE